MRFEDYQRFINNQGTKEICVSNSIEPIIEDLFTQKTGSSCKRGSEGCWSSFTRTAELCGYQYVIKELHFYGYSYYGPFKIDYKK